MQIQYRILRSAVVRTLTRLTLLTALLSCGSEKGCEPGRPFQNIVGAWNLTFKKGGVGRVGVLILRANGRMLDPYHTLHQPPPIKPGFPPVVPELYYKVEGNQFRYYVVYPNATAPNEWNEGEITLNECQRMYISLSDVNLILMRRPRK